MKKFTKLVLTLLGIAGSIFSSSAAHLRDQILLSARMNGSEEVPAVITNAVGVAAITLNGRMDSISVNFTVTGLSGNITGAHFHKGNPGSTGPVVFNLMPFMSGTSAAGYITGSSLTPTLLADFLAGNLYVNIHTVANPNGEIRGQVIPEADIQFVANLNGAQQNPAVTTSGFGLATIALSKHSGKLMIKAVVTGLSGAISGAHLHKAAIGVNGPVVLNLTTDLSGNSVSKEVDPADFLADLLAGNIYINFHTAANPDGEVRGQLLTDKNFAFDAFINAEQEVPAGTSTGKGIANIKVSPTMDTVKIEIVFDGLTSAPTGAHFHTGAAGVNGPVFYNLFPGLAGNRITAMLTGANIPPAFIQNLLTGNFYINLHTSANPNGEIRGQIYRLLREGYSAIIEGGQEVPAVASQARGTALVSVDRNQTDLHYMVVANGITPNGMHFHSGKTGENGPVIFNITPVLVNNGAFGYWKSTDLNPFTIANSIAFRKDSIYINLHTDANPNGEIRGQMIRGFDVDNVTEVRENIHLSEVRLYPNPSQSKLNIGIAEDVTELKVYNAMGGMVSVQRPVFSEQGVTIDVSGLKQGMYFLEGKTTRSVFRKQFIRN